MAIIKGNKVWKATSYELYEVLEGYTFTVKDNKYGNSDTTLYINGKKQSTSIGTWENVKTVRLYSESGDVIYFSIDLGTFPDDSRDTKTSYTLTGDVIISEIYK